jgi:hypothetical protein
MTVNDIHLIAADWRGNERAIYTVGVSKGEPRNAGTMELVV